MKLLTKIDKTQRSNNDTANEDNKIDKASEEKNYDVKAKQSHIHQMRQKLKGIISRIRAINMIPGNSRLKHSVPFKNIYRTITEFYLDKLDEIEVNKKETEKNLLDNLMPFFNKKFGKYLLTEKRLKEFLASLYRYEGNPRIAIFMKQMDLTGKNSHGIIEQSIYLDSLNFVVRILANDFLL